MSASYTELKENPRLFPTPTVDEPNYPFNNKEVKQVKKFEIKDKSDHHSAFISEKLSKPGSKWYEIHNTMSPTKNLKRHNALIITAGEFYRFAFGGPKYRTKKLNKKEERVPILSKGIDGFEDLFDYSNQKGGIFNIEDKRSLQFTEKHCLDDMGRILLPKYLNREDDLTSQNLGVDKDKKFVAIDPGRTFAPLTNNLEEDRDNITKYTAYRPSLEKYSHGKWDRLKIFFYLNDVKPDDMGTHPDVYDYDSLPALKYFLPRNWTFIKDLPKYTKFLMNHPKFLNEKHFAALKELVTKNIKLEMIRIHTLREDRKSLQEQTNATLNNFLVELKKSDSFLNYLNKYRLDAVNIIFYEIREFITENSHYQHRGNQAADQSQWNKIAEVVVEEFDNVLKNLNGKELSEKEKRELKLFADGIRDNHEEKLDFVKSFYKEQQAHIRAQKVKKLFIKPNKEAPKQSTSKLFSDPTRKAKTTSAQKTHVVILGLGRAIVVM